MDFEFASEVILPIVGVLLELTCRLELRFERVEIGAPVCSRRVSDFDSLFYILASRR
jgi:hypothetical protein